MNTHADNIQENKSQSAADGLSEKRSSRESTYQYVENRPEAIAQRKLQELANNSPQVKQLRAIQEMANNSPQAKQAAQFQTMADNQSVQQQQPPIQKKDNKISSPSHYPTVFQRVVDLTSEDMNKTDGDQYFIETDDRNTLYVRVIKIIDGFTPDFDHIG